MPDDKTIDFVVAFLSLGLLALGVGSVTLGWLVRMWDRVKGNDTEIMSHSLPTDHLSALSSKDGQRDGRTDSLVYSRDELLMFYRILRKYGIPREEIRPILKAMRIPLSNDVWSAAPPADEHVTPIAGRRTAAQFEQDPELRYEAPPR